MQLQPRTTLQPPPDLATGLARCAAELGQRPAVSVLTPGGRQEAGFRTLAQWAAKGAHLLQTDHDLGPGHQVYVDVPPGWMLAAVCAAVWWTGAAVSVVRPDTTACCVVHESRPLPDHDTVYVVGDAADGGVTAPSDGLEWVTEVQAFPDRPPAPRASADEGALVTSTQMHTHHEVIALLRHATGTRGVDTAEFVGHAVVEVAARPLVTGNPTVVLTGGLGREAARGDGVRSWA